ncbi:hypothetical protein JCM10908_006980 [Rhodotorula pacifica]|uniref:uncharacterized protein n=1 Tax=Rhodotorula pacifica TaxID=1495444 RepID=UPI00317856C7
MLRVRSELDLFAAKCAQLRRDPVQTLDFLPSTGLAGGSANSMQPMWSYQASIKAAEPASTKLTLRAAAPVAASPDVVLDTSTLVLRFTVTAD